jgi:hypothetical protein
VCVCVCVCVPCEQRSPTYAQSSATQSSDEEEVGGTLLALALAPACAYIFLIFIARRGLTSQGAGAKRWRSARPSGARAVRTRCSVTKSAVEC